MTVDGKRKGFKLENVTKPFMPITTPFFVGNVAKNIRLNKNIRALVGRFLFFGGACDFIVLCLFRPEYCLFRDVFVI